jgi:hypothetical protein
MVTYVIITPGVTIADLVLLNPSAALACSIVAFWRAAALLSIAYMVTNGAVVLFQPPSRGQQVALRRW